MDPEVFALRRQRAVAAFGSLEKLAAHAEALAIDPDDWIGRLRDVRLVGPAPDWVRAFRTVFERLDSSEFPLDEVRRWARREAEACWPETLPYGPDALEGPIEFLASRLGTIFEPTRVVEQKLGARPGWMERFWRSPALAFAVGRVSADWLSDIGRIAARTAADRTVLARAFFVGQDPGVLLRIDSGLGDPHFGGRSVAILRFERGSVVYKPKDLRVAPIVGQVAVRTGGHGLAPPEMLLRGEYAWEPVHEVTPLSDRGDAEAYFGALGGWLAVLQALGASDFWFDNLIADGRVPRFIDFETAVQPPLDWTAKVPPKLHAAVAPLRATVLGVGILPLQMPIRDGEDPTDIGCLSRPGEHRTPVPRPSGGLQSWQEDRFAPHYPSGATADAAEHFDAFEDGYLQVARTLADPKVQKDIVAALRRAADAPIRHIRLDTWTCYRMIQQSLAPRHLGDGVWRELALHAVVPDRRDMVGVLREGVVRDLRRIDVPLFQTRLGSRNLFGAEGERYPSFFAHDAISETRYRLRAMAGAADDERVAWLRSGFSLRLGNSERRPPSSADLPPATPDDLLAWADEIASTVAGWVVSGLGGAPTWLGLVHNVFNGVRVLGPLGFDILSGRAGVALALLEIAYRLGRSDLSDLAREVLRGAGQEFVKSPRRGLDAGAGYVVGVGGLVAALAREPALRPLALDAYRTAATHEVWMNSGHDFVAGLAGWRVAARAFSEQPPERHGKVRPYAPSARPRLAIWLDPGSASLPRLDRRAAARMRSGFEREGSWFPERWLDDRHNLSGIDGLPALAVCFARLANPSTSGAASAWNASPATLSLTPRCFAAC